MLLSVVAFELRHQLRAPVFWVSGIVFFLIVFASVTLGEVQIGGRGGVHLNAPYAISLTVLVMSVFYMFTTTAFLANTAVRDDETGFGPILRSTRVGRATLMYGRFAGAWTAAALAFLFVPLGVVAGGFMPWVDRERLGPVLLEPHLRAYLLWALPTLFATGGLLFALATATRSMMATYMGVLALLVAFFAVRVAAARSAGEGWAPWVDPFGVSAFSEATRYLSTAERNAGDAPLTAAVVGNRLVWTAVGALSLLAAWPLARDEARSRRPRRAAPAEPEAPSPVRAIRPATPRHDLRAALRQFALRTRFEATLVLRSPAFAVLLALGLINVGLRLGFGDGPPPGVALHPVTRIIVRQLRESFEIIPLIVGVFYAGELVWRDRDRRLEEIVGAAPAPDWSFAFPKMLAVAAVLLIVTAVGALAGVAVQLVKGGATPDLGQLLAWFVLPQSLGAMQIAVLAVFLQTIAPHKFVGWLLMLGVIVLLSAAPGLGIDDDLLLYGSTPPEPLSDMNGAGVFGLAAGWFRAWWSLVALLLAILSYGLWRRGVQTALHPRLLRLPQRLGRPGGIAAAAGLVAAAAVGGFVVLNTHVWNAHPSRLDDERRAAAMERALRPYLDLPQPKITAVALNVDIRPRDLAVEVRGSYLVRNDTAEPIRELHLATPRGLGVKALSVEGGRPLRSFERFDHRIFAFDSPLMPGEIRRVSFETRLAQRGFRDRDNLTAVAANGSFLFDRQVAPTLGVDRNAFLQDRNKRRRRGLHPFDLRPPPLEDDAARRFNALRPDADFVTSDITVSTDADQTPVAPGYKVADVTVGGRRTARFRSEAPMLPALAIQSARYAEARGRWRGVDLSILYEPRHAWNAPRMLRVLGAGLDAYTAAFGPYQFRQVRVVEFPDYAQFAVSLPNTIPYSEGIGFVFKAPADPSRSTRLDMVSYVTAHELAHQWWAHQATPSAQQGGATTTETLAQYSALKVLEHMYGPAQVQAALAFERDRYLRGRAAADRDELPLSRVENQPYIHYGKGALVMHRLRREWGEAAVDHALRRYLEAFRLKGPPFARSLDLLAALRTEAGPDPRRQQLLTDLFERIGFYDLRAYDPVSRRAGDGRWTTTFKVKARKLYVDARGVEHEAPMDEAVTLSAYRSGPSPAGAPVRTVALLTSGVRQVSVTTAFRPARVEVGGDLDVIERDKKDNAAAVPDR